MTQTETQTPTYAQLCAAIGQRHFLIQKLSSEIAALTQAVDKLEKDQAVSAETPQPQAG